MADTRRSAPADAGAGRSPGALRDAVATALAGVLPQGGIAAVALSGGRDSIALLDAAIATCRPGVTIVALHVHHGLSSHADHWAAQCATLCATLGVRFIERRVVVPVAPRTSLEDAARRARYRALADMAGEAGATVVLLAHHQDDQAETMLLQLVRGAGPRGLAAMPARHRAGDVAWLRPLLDVPRGEIDAYVARHALAYVDDESNARPVHRRNALRHEVVPALRKIAPGYPATLARAARHQAEAAQLLADLAAIDAAPHFDGTTLDRACLQRLGDARARNVLRWFLAQHGLPAPPAARLAAMLAQLRHARADAQVRLAHAGCELGVFAGRIVVHAAPPPPFARTWHGEPALDLPHGTLARVDSCDGPVDLARLFAARIDVRSRVGGERLRTHVDGSARPLKDVLREAAMPPWQRQMLPLVFANGALVAVPGIALDPAFRVPAGAEGGALVWRPAAIAPPLPFG